MAPTPTLRASAQTGEAQTLVTPSFTPSANAILLAFVFTIRADHTTAYSFGVSGGGLTWSQLVASSTVNAFGNAFYAGRIEVWTATVGGSPGSMTVTADAFSSGSQQAEYAVQVIEVPAGSTIVQQAVNIQDVGQSGSNQLTVTLPGNATDDNLVLAAFGQLYIQETPGEMNAPSGFSNLDVQSDPYVTLSSYTRTNLTTAAVTSTSDFSVNGSLWLLAGAVAEISGGDDGGLTVDALRIAQTSVHSPTVAPGAVSVAAQAIAGTVVRTPNVTTATQVAAQAISGTSLHAPSVTVGAVTIGAQAIAGTSVHTPTVAQAVSGQTVDAASIAQTSLHTPSVAPGAVSVAAQRITGTTLHQPAVAVGAVTVAPNAISGTSVHTPNVTSVQTVVAVHLTGTALHAPRVRDTISAVAHRPPLRLRDRRMGDNAVSAPLGSSTVRSRVPSGNTTQER